MTLRVAFAGTPEFALPAFHALLGSRHAVTGVLTQPDRPKGRGRQLTASPVKLAAQAAGLPVSQPVSLRSDNERSELASWTPDVLVVVAYGLILPAAVLELPRLGCVNIHASLLPRWRGAAPIQRAILAGDSETGVSIMRMEAGLDTGPVYLERRVEISPNDTASSLQQRLSVEGASAVLQVLDDLEADRAVSAPQAAEGVTYATKIDKSEAKIDWRESAAVLDRKIRAFNRSPVAETRLNGEQLRIYRGRVEEGPPNAHLPGTIVAVRSDSFLVACGDGYLAVTEVQRPGRKPVASRDLINTVQLAGVQLG